MTSIFYPDLTAVSPNGKYTLEARSPHNGTICRMDGTRPSDNDFQSKYREHQREFRYRLIDNSRDQLFSKPVMSVPESVVWERWQQRTEDSPHEVLVSDDGWSILRTHGFKPEVIAVSPNGRDVIRVIISEPKHEDSQEETAGAEDAAIAQGNTHRWRAANLQCTTAGNFWTEHSSRYFLRVDEVDYFNWRTRRGERLLIDLTNATLLDDEEQRRASLILTMKETEIASACFRLAELSNQVDAIQQLLARRRQDSDAETENPLWEKIRNATSAIHLAGVHRVAECVPLLRRLEEIDCPSYSTGSTAMESAWWLEVQFLRPILHHTLRLLGQEPQGYAAFHFKQGNARFQMPEHISDRRARAATLKPSLDAMQVLRIIGSPDHVRRESHKAGEFYEWTEDWDYDFRSDDRWVTLRITWEERKRAGRIARVEEFASPWLGSDEREAEILQF